MNRESYAYGHVQTIPAEKISVSATLDTLRIGPVPTGRTWKIVNTAFVDVDHGATDARLYVETGGIKHYLSYQGAMTANVLYNKNESYWLSEGQTLALEIAGSTVGDTLRMFVNAVEYWASWPGDKAPYQAPKQE